MALLMVIGSIAAERVAAAMGAHRSVGLAMLLLSAGIASLAVLGRDSSFLALMPSFALVGVGGGLSVPLTAMILGAMPEAQAGVASGVFNASREIAGLLADHRYRRDPHRAAQSAVARAGHAHMTRTCPAIGSD
jgi:hypothetical protein